MKIESGTRQDKLLRRIFAPLGTFTFGILIAAATGAAIAQGPPGHDPYNPPPGHGGVPPGQAKKGGVPPGQAKKNNQHNDWRFQGNDRDRFYSHYSHDANRWRGKKRPMFVRGQAIPTAYRIQTVPRSYWQSAPPPPPGYQYGYYDGYVVAYNPTSRVIADVLDLVTAAATR